MLTLLINNIGTITAILILAGIICGVAAVMIKDKKRGNSSCGCNCAHCAMTGSCRKVK